MRGKHRATKCDREGHRWFPKNGYYDRCLRPFCFQIRVAPGMRPRGKKGQPCSP